MKMNMSQNVSVSSKLKSASSRLTARQFQSSELYVTESSKLSGTASFELAVPESFEL
jgi:hypothetical protein